MAIENPRVFMSYSWTSEEYADRVVQLASQLQADGIEVVLDRWDLREGQDKHVYMERAVSDPTMDRVLVLCDPLYTQKANAREGGVGTETLIISPEVYRKAEQTKFLPVIMERGSDGDVAVPTYLDGRIYIDLSDARREAVEYQRLVRNIYGRPDFEKPPLGAKPRYLEAGPSLLTGRSLQLFQDAVLRDQRHKAGLLQDYLDKLVAAFEAQAIDEMSSFEELDDAAVTSIDAFRLYRDEFIEMLGFVARYMPTESVAGAIKMALERMTSFRISLPNRKWDQSLETENLGFISWELFLYSVAVLTRAAQYEMVQVLLESYYVESTRRGEGSLRGYGVMDPGFRLLDEYRNRRLQLRKTSVAAFLVHSNRNSTVHLAALVEADLILWFRSCHDKSVEWWYPRLLVYGESIGQLPLFVRSQSAMFFKKFAPVLGATDADDFRRKLESFQDGQFHQVGFLSGRHSYSHFMRPDEIGSRA